MSQPSPPFGAVLAVPHHHHKPPKLTFDPTPYAPTIQTNLPAYYPSPSPQKQTTASTYQKQTTPSYIHTTAAPHEYKTTSKSLPYRHGSTTASPYNKPHPPAYPPLKFSTTPQYNPTPAKANHAQHVHDSQRHAQSQQLKQSNDNRNSKQLDPFKASIVERFNSQILNQRSKRGAKGSADPDPQFQGHQSQTLKESLQSLSLDDLLVLIDSFEPGASAEVEKESGQATRFSSYPLSVKESGKFSNEKDTLPGVQGTRVVSSQQEDVLSRVQGSSTVNIFSGDKVQSRRPIGQTNSEFAESLGANFPLPNEGLTTQSLRILRTGQSFEPMNLRNTDTSQSTHNLFQQPGSTNTEERLFQGIDTFSKTPIGGAVEDIQRSPGTLQVNTNINSYRPDATILNTFGANINSGLRNSFTDPRLGNNLVINNNAGLNIGDYHNLLSGPLQGSNINPLKMLSRLQHSNALDPTKGSLKTNDLTRHSQTSPRPSHNVQSLGLFSDPSINFESFNSKRQLDGINGEKKDGESVQVEALGADFDDPEFDSRPVAKSPLKINQSDALAEVLRRIEMLERESGGALGGVLHPRAETENSPGDRGSVVFPTSFHHTNHHAKPHPNLPIHPRIVQVSEVPQLNPVYPDQFHNPLQLTPVKPPPYVPKKSPSPHYGAIGGVLHPHDLHHDELHDPRPPHAPQGPHHPHDSHHSVPQHKKHYKPIVTKV